RDAGARHDKAVTRVERPDRRAPAPSTTRLRFNHRTVRSALAACVANSAAHKGERSCCVATKKRHTQRQVSRWPRNGLTRADYGEARQLRVGEQGGTARAGA